MGTISKQTTLMRTNFDMKEKVMKVSKSGGNLDAKNVQSSENYGKLKIIAFVL